jgi:uncharacterized protein (DUF4415 family)
MGFAALGRSCVLSHFRRTGRDWQTRINAALCKAANLPKEKRKA